MPAWLKRWFTQNLTCSHCWHDASYDNDQMRRVDKCGREQIWHVAANKCCNCDKTDTLIGYYTDLPDELNLSVSARLSNQQRG